MLTNYWYNNNYTFVQTGTDVMLLTEMVHDARVVRIGQHASRQRHPPVDGRFDRTLGRRRAHRRDHELPPAARVPRRLGNVKVTERFTPKDARHHPLQVHRRGPDDVDSAVQRRTAIPRLPESELVYEYACHEGNYALEGVLSGARAQNARR